jgi:hypothetical protein
VSGGGNPIPSNLFLCIRSWIGQSALNQTQLAKSDPIRSSSTSCRCSSGIGINPFRSLSLQSFGFEITFALLPDFRGLVYISIENMVLVCTDRLAGEQRTWF